MSDHLLVENLDSKDYIGNFRAKTSSGELSLSRVRLTGNEITRVPRKSWEAVIKAGNGINVINDKLQQGRLKVHGGGKMSEENRGVLDHREVAYANFVNIRQQIISGGGNDNPDFKKHIDEKCIPSFQMTRTNLGDTVNHDEYERFRNRLSKELASGMHNASLSIPGFLPPKDVKPDKKNVQKEEATGLDFEGMVDKLHKIMPDLELNNGLRNGVPKAGALKEAGINLSKDQRKFLWDSYQEKYNSETEED